MKPTQAAKTAAKLGWDAFEDIAFEKTTKPIISEIGNELVGFLGANRFGRNSGAIAQEDLKRAREAQNIEKEQKTDEAKSQERTSQIIAEMRRQYQSEESRTNKQEGQMREQVEELKGEVAQLAKAAGVDTKIHLENTPQKGKISLQTIKLLTTIIKTLRIKTEESKNAKDLVAQRINAKPPTGMLAWVSGKQMKVHEQGTLQLQG